MQQVTGLNKQPHTPTLQRPLMSRLRSALNLRAYRKRKTAVLYRKARLRQSYTAREHAVDTRRAVRRVPLATSTKSHPVTGAALSRHAAGSRVLENEVP